MSKTLLSAAIASTLFAGAVFNTDPLADLGLDLGGDEGGVATDDALLTGGAAASETVATDTPAVEGEKKTRVQIAIAPLEFGTIDLIPAQKVGGAKSSKYEFDKLAAPVENAENASGYDYSYFLAKPEDAENFDEDAFKRSVQSASTAANRAAKKAGTDERFLTRQHIVKGEFVGVLVLRVDGTVDSEDAAEEAAAA